MLFGGDEARFSKSYVPSQKDGQVLGVRGHSTESHIGPGSYYNPGSDGKRGGWSNSSFSRRSPMTPNRGSPRDSALSRGDSYISGVLTSHGTMASPLSKRDLLTPGPGYYDRDVFQTLGTKSSPGGGASVNGTVRSTTPRFAFSNSAVLKDGVVFQSAENNHNPIGPGYYSPPVSSMSKPTFNVRISNNSANRGRSASSPRSSHDRYQH